MSGTVEGLLDELNAKLDELRATKAQKVEVLQRVVEAAEARGG